MQVIELQNVMKALNLQTLVLKIKVTGFKSKGRIRSKLVVNDETMKQVNIFSFLVCTVSLYRERDVFIKVEKFDYVNGTFRSTLKKKLHQKRKRNSKMRLSIATFLYGVKAGQPIEANKIRIQSAEIKFLKSAAATQGRQKAKQ